MKKVFGLMQLCLTLSISCTQQKKSVDHESTVIQPQDLPNIVLIIGDDQGYPYFGFMGADYVETPNMDKLAESGTLFTNGYVPKNHCRPSLQSLMTGNLPVQYSIQVAEIRVKERKTPDYQNLSEEDKKEWDKNFDFHSMKYFNTLPKILAEKGYVSFQGGKWWEFNYQNGGFDYGMTKGWSREDEGKNDWFLKFMGGEGTELARSTMQPVYDFIYQQKDKPLYIWFAPELPHYPFDAPDKYYNIYKDKNMTESAKRYYANCTWFDDGVGELVRYLKEQNEFENTLFIYVNDNGWEQNPDQEFRHDSLRWHNGGDKGKLSMYDQSFRTPVIFSWPGKIDANKKIHGLIHSTDIPATILDYLDIEIPDDYFGVSYKSVIEGDSDSYREEIIGKVDQIRWEGDMMGRNIEGYWIRTNDWFFSWNLTTQEQSLYDMNNDPSNNENLLDKKPELVKEFKDRIEEWKRTNSI